MQVSKHYSCLWSMCFCGKSFNVKPSPAAQWSSCRRVWSWSDEELVTWHMNWGITRWKIEPLYPKPCSPVHRALKFSRIHTEDHAWHLCQRNTFIFIHKAHSEQLMVEHILQQNRTKKQNVFKYFTCCFGHNIRVQLQLRKRVKGLKTLLKYCKIITLRNKYP